MLFTQVFENVFLKCVSILMDLQHWVLKLTLGFHQIHVVSCALSKVKTFGMFLLLHEKTVLGLPMREKTKE